MAYVSTISVTDSAQVTVLPPPTVGMYQFVAVGNNGTNTAYIKFIPEGGDVTPQNGIPLPAGASILLDQDDSPVLNNGIFAICDSGEDTTLAVQAY
jgi:hypothetical protein